MSTVETNSLLTVPEVAGILRVSRATVYRHVADGTLPAVRLGDSGSIRVDRDQFDQWLYGACADRPDPRKD
jgi:excisionase family DNA binding protein